MKNLLLILAIVAVVVVLAGALNHEAQVSVDYLVGTTPSFSLFWLAVAAATALVVAVLAGWSLGRAGAGVARRKLEKELEATYRRLRAAESRQIEPAPAPTTSVAAGGVTVAAADEAPTVVAERPADEAETGVAEQTADEADTVVAQRPAGEAETAVAEQTADEADTAVVQSPAAGREGAGEAPEEQSRA